MVSVNRLGASTSPYLLQHKDNPVAWWPWSEEALNEAKTRDVPILLSVGYSSCHWCHVMAHESFEDDEVAAVLNENFVSIKVDREERPDIDAVYMESTVALTGQGGWPMTCLLTPEGETFYAGTYFPKTQFIRLLTQVRQLWREQRDEVRAAGQRITATIAEQAALTSIASELPTAEDLARAVGALEAQFDDQRGGFGGAPKFPPSMVLEFLLREHERTNFATPFTMAARTLDAMARGGIYDQLAGGFARYSVDAAWVVPHFEKMLYDNAQLLRVYLHWWRLTSAPLAERIARETADFLIRDLGTPQGGFAAALDADSAGVEGLTYVFSRADLVDILGQSRGALAAELFTVTEHGTFEAGASTLQLPRDPGALGIDEDAFAEIRALLLAARTTRPQPARDDKVVAAWNGLATAALAEAGILLDEPRYLAAAEAAAGLLLRLHLVDGPPQAGGTPRLRRTSRDGVVGDALAVAEDYGDVAEGLLALHQATTDPRWLTAAGELLGFALTHFAAEGGSFYDTGSDAELLVRRPKEVSDNAHPSGTSALINALITYSALTGSTPHRDAAERALAANAVLVEHPRFFGWGLTAAEALLAGPQQVAIVSDRAGPQVAIVSDRAGPHSARVGDSDNGLTRAAWQNRPPGAVIVSGLTDQPAVPLLAGRPLVDGGAAAYVCRGMVCDLPVTTVEALVEQLDHR
ncbi:MAG TPA: thioredoxin domain-containing protein [Jatrophihabitans sp.]|jgi:hypothetical protein